MLYEAYLNESPKLLDNISQGLAQNNADMVNYAAHTLKSSSTALGGIRLGNLCQSLETSARDQHLSSGAELLTQIKDEYEQVAAELTQYLKS